MSATQNSTSESTEPKVIGQVKWFNIKAGYGFITLVQEGENKGKDIFVHYSSLKVVNSQYRYLVQGEYVEFHLVKLEGDKYEYHAVDVSGMFGGPIMCEARRSSNNSRHEGESGNVVHPRSSESQEPRRIVKKTLRDVVASVDENNFEKVVKKRQPRTKTAVLIIATPDHLFKKIHK